MRNYCGSLKDCSFGLSFSYLLRSAKLAQHEQSSAMKAVDARDEQPMTSSHGEAEIKDESAPGIGERVSSQY